MLHLICRSRKKGIKPSCALPYQLYADGKLSADKRSFTVKFTASNEIFGKAATGSPFNVYAPSKYLQQNDNAMGEVRTWAYGLTAGDTITDVWPLQEFENDAYHLRVYGPNGFFREYKGNAADPDMEVACEYQRSLSDSKKLTGNIELKLHNLSKGQHIVEITDHAYKTNNHKKVLDAGIKTHLALDLAKSYGWYDFSVKVSGSHNFEKRFAGRVETGKPGFSDPHMGNVI